MHEGAVADGNHALLLGGLAGILYEHASRLMSFVELESPPMDSQGNYLDTITIVMKSGKYDVTVRPQQ